MSTEPRDGVEPTPRTTVRRLAARGRYDRAMIHAILDEALVCHVGFVSEGQPFVMPTIHARIGEHLYVHGSPASRMLQALRGGAPACVTVTLLDALVLARSAFHHSMNYRSVVILGRGSEVVDEVEKSRALGALVEHVVPGRGGDARPPSPTELRGTMVVRFAIEEASAKARSGPVGDDEEDYGLPVWAGVLPLALQPGTPEDDSRLIPGVRCPEYVRAYARPRAAAGS